MTEVDVVIPSFNQTTLLYAAVSSCKQQTFQINKIIIVDDGSIPEVSKDNRKTFQGDEQVLYIENVHTGLPGISRRMGIEAVTSKWVAFLDSDDLWAPNKIERQLDLASRTNADLIYTNATNFGQIEGVFHQEMPTSLQFNQLVRTNYIINSSVLVKREMLIRVGYADSPRLRAVEDYATWLRIAAVGKLVGLDESLTSYRVADGTIRSQDIEDPRIHALADFLMWSQSADMIPLRELRKFKKSVVKMIERQYG